MKRKARCICCKNTEAPSGKRVSKMRGACKLEAQGDLGSPDSNQKVEN